MAVMHLLVSGYSFAYTDLSFKHILIIVTYFMDMPSSGKITVLFVNLYAFRRDMLSQKDSVYAYDSSKNCPSMICSPLIGIAEQLKPNVKQALHNQMFIVKRRWRVYTNISARAQWS
jgi:hypothetical protein